MADVRKVLLIGYGNPGRIDDGLGPALAQAVEQMNLPNVTVDADYQLAVEDAALVAEHDVVIFADAAVSGDPPFTFRRIKPRRAVSFSSHSVAPEALVALAMDLFARQVDAYMLGIRGFEFNQYAERLSDSARCNLQAAIAFAETILRNGAFEQAAEETDIDSFENENLSKEGQTCKMEST